MSGKTKKQIRSNTDQLNKLIDYMKANKIFANGDMGPLEYERRDAMWQNLADHLNKMGPYKSLEQWKQTWRDLKRKGRKAYERRKRGIIADISELPKSTRKIIETLECVSSTGIGPDESEINQNNDTAGEQQLNTPRYIDNSNLVEDGNGVFEYTDFPLAEESMEVIEDSESDGLINDSQPFSGTEKRSTECSPSTFLSLQEDHNFLLRRICGLMEEANTLRREKNNLIRKEIRQSKRTSKVSNKPKLSF